LRILLDENLPWQLGPLVPAILAATLTAQKRALTIVEL